MLLRSARLDPAPIRPVAVLLALLAADALLLLLFLACEQGLITIWTVRRLSHFEMEANLPTWLSSAQLLAAAGLLWIRGAALREAGAGHWRLLWAGAMLLLVLSIDEATALHEGVTNTLLLRGIPPWSWASHSHTVEWITLGLYGIAGSATLWLLRRHLWKAVAEPGSLTMAAGLALMVAGGLILDALWPKGWHQSLGAALEDSLELVGGSVLVYGGLLKMGAPRGAGGSHAPAFGEPRTTR